MTADELAKLSPEQKRVAIADACGWKHCRNTLWQRDGKLYRNSPNYLNDLNAMHEAEKVLSEEQRVTYLMRLSQPSKECMPLDPNYADEQFLLVTRTAAQRSDAFLLSL